MQSSVTASAAHRQGNRSERSHSIDASSFGRDAPRRKLVERAFELGNAALRLVHAGPRRVQQAGEAVTGQRKLRIEHSAGHASSWTILPITTWTGTTLIPRMVTYAANNRGRTGWLNHHHRQVGD